MLILNVVDDWYITATPTNFVIGEWNGHTYLPKNNSSFESKERFPKLVNEQYFGDLYSCFSFILKKYQIDAFYQAENGKELIEILANLNKSMTIISDAISDAFLKQQKEYKKQKRKDRG